MQIGGDMKKILVEKRYHQTFFPVSRKSQEKVISSFEDGLYGLVIKHRKNCVSHEVSEMELRTLSQKVHCALDQYYFDDDLRDYLISLDFFISSCETSGLNLAKNFFLF
jgi:hypothetical protein